MVRCGRLLSFARVERAPRSQAGAREVLPVLSKAHRPQRGEGLVEVSISCHGLVLSGRLLSPARVERALQESK